MNPFDRTPTSHPHNPSLSGGKPLNMKHYFRMKDGSIQRKVIKVKGKANVKAAKRQRQKTRRARLS